MYYIIRLYTSILHKYLNEAGKNPPAPGKTHILQWLLGGLNLPPTLEIINSFQLPQDLSGFSTSPRFQKIAQSQETRVVGPLTCNAASLGWDCAFSSDSRPQERIPGPSHYFCITNLSKHSDENQKTYCSACGVYGSGIWTEDSRDRGSNFGSLHWEDSKSGSDLAIGWNLSWGTIKNSSPWLSCDFFVWASLRFLRAQWPIPKMNTSRD